MLAIKPYNVPGKDKPVDFILAAVRGTLAGVSSAQKAKELQQQQEIENDMKIRQLDLMQQQIVEGFSIDRERMVQQHQEFMESLQNTNAMADKQIKHEDQMSAKATFQSFLLECIRGDRDQWQFETTQRLQVFRDAKEASSREKIVSAELASRESLALAELASRESLAKVSAEDRDLDREIKRAQLESLKEERADRKLTRKEEGAIKAYDRLGIRATAIGKYANTIGAATSAGGMTGDDVLTLGKDGAMYVSLYHKAEQEKGRYQTSDAREALSKLSKVAGWYEYTRLGFDPDVYIFEGDPWWRGAKEHTIKFSAWIDSPEGKAMFSPSKPPAIQVDTKKVGDVGQFNALSTQIDLFYKEKKIIDSVYADVLSGAGEPEIIPEETTGTTKQPTTKKSVTAATPPPQVALDMYTPEQFANYWRQYKDKFGTDTSVTYFDDVRVSHNMDAIFGKAYLDALRARLSTKTTKSGRNY